VAVVEASEAVGDQARDLAMLFDRPLLGGSLVRTVMYMPQAMMCLVVLARAGSPSARQAATGPNQMGCRSAAGSGWVGHCLRPGHATQRGPSQVCGTGSVPDWSARIT